VGNHEGKVHLKLKTILHYEDKFLQKLAEYIVF